MDRVVNVKVSSRRSSKIGDEFLTFEMTLESDVSGMDEKEKKDYISKLWDFAGEEVDNQLIEANKSLRC